MKIVKIRPFIPLFLGILVPMYLFGKLAEDVWSKEGFWWDKTLLTLAHRHAVPHLTTIMIGITNLGFRYGTVPLDVTIFLVLAYLRRWRDTVFFGLAVGGSALLNLFIKYSFHRSRPSLWLSPDPASGYSFPSGHAMGSMALVTAVVLLAWPSKYRWLVGVIGLLFVLLVGISRVYLGVHYPSDVLAAWAASFAWVFGIRRVVYGYFPRRHTGEQSIKARL